MLTELKFTFNDNEEDRLSIKANAEYYQMAIRDFINWLNNEIKSNGYYDVETLEYVDDKFHAILMSLGIGV